MKILLVLVLVAALIIPAVVQAAVDDSYTKALFHFEGSNVTDESGNAWTSTNVTISTDQYVFGNSSGYFNGSSSQLTISSGDYNYYGDFTIDFRVYTLGSSTVQILYATGDDTYPTGFALVIKSNGELGVWSHGNWQINGGSMSGSTWHHVALERNGSNVKLFLDGTQSGDIWSYSYTVNNTEAKIGIDNIRCDTCWFHGYLDEFRISEGIARWTSSFTTPSAAYEPVATQTPTKTTTPTDTITPTNTQTRTVTTTATKTPTRTPTVQATSIYGEVIWAVGPVTLSGNVKAAIETLLHDAPPSGAQGNIYASTFISGVDTAWDISLANLVGVVDPWTDWNIETDAVLQFSVTCTGTDPTFTCGYYSPPSAGGGSSLRFPWQTGFSAQYGVSGVHAGSGVIPGSSAVDFLGRDSVSGSMPPLAVAAADGVIDWACGDNIGMAIRVTGGPVYLAYYHFAPGQDFHIGQTISQGQVLGSLKYGNFSQTEGVCTQWGTQASDQYHLHFVFLPTSPGYLEIGGCVLDLSTQKFVCNGNTYSIGDYIPNGGDVSDPHPPPDDGGSGGGGVHIWDGIVAAIVELASGSINKYLPAQQPLFGYVMAKINLITVALMSMVTAFYLTGLSGSFMMFFISGLIYLELVYLSATLLVGLAKLIF